MAGPVIRFLARVIWAISGALMAFNPPPPGGGRRAHSLPAIGFITLVGGIWIAVQAIRARDPKDSGRPPRHAAPTSARQRIRFWSSIAVAFPANAAVLWWAHTSGSLSLLGLAIGCLGPTLLALIAHARYPGLR